jgi:hypothetical protein
VNKLYKLANTFYHKLAQESKPLFEINQVVKKIISEKLYVIDNVRWNTQADEFMYRLLDLDDLKKYKEKRKRDRLDYDADGKLGVDDNIKITSALESDLNEFLDYESKTPIFWQ